jgi:hypothetical protein
MRLLTAAMHMFQPLARLVGRMKLGLTPWRQCVVSGISMPWPIPRNFTVWSEEWRSSIDWLENLELGLKGLRGVVSRGGDYDRWDLEMRGGLLGSARVLMAVEEHGGGKQLVRFKAWPRCSAAGYMFAILFAALAAGAAVAQAWVAFGVLNFIALLAVMRMFVECGSAMSGINRVLNPGNITTKS